MKPKALPWVALTILWLSTPFLVRGSAAIFTDSAQNTDNTFSAASCFPGDSGLLSPGAEAADTGGNGDGFELNAADAFADDTSYASNVDGASDNHRYYDYGISIPSGCAVKGIEVRLDWWLDSTFGTSSMSVELSWDAGSSWTAAETDSTESTSEHTATLGSSTDTWGHAWTVDELGNANFRVRLTANSTSAFRDFYLDWVPVKVYYGPAGGGGGGAPMFILVPPATSTPTPVTVMPTPVDKPTPIDTPTPAAVDTATPTPLDTATPVATDTPTATDTPPPTDTPPATPPPTATPTPS